MEIIDNCITDVDGFFRNNMCVGFYWWIGWIKGVGFSSDSNGDGKILFRFIRVYWQATDSG